MERMAKFSAGPAVEQQKPSALYYRACRSESHVIYFASADFTHGSLRWTQCNAHAVELQSVLPRVKERPAFLKSVFKLRNREPSTNTKEKKKHSILVGVVGLGILEFLHTGENKTEQMKK